MQFLFLTALKAEAHPLITAYRLQKDSTTHLYSQNHIDLLITGVGVAKTTKRIQSYLSQHPDLSHTVIINIGIAGGNPNQTIIGDLYRVNAIHDEATNRSFFPDIMLRHTQKEISLTTVSAVITKNRERYPGLVDMEAYAIFQIMSKVVPVHRLVFLKVVSDHMNVKDWESLDVTRLIQTKIDEIQSVVDGYKVDALADRKILSVSEMELLSHGVSQLKLTETQHIKLITWLENSKKRNGESIKKLEPYFNLISNSKAERNQIFDKIRQQLSA